MYTRTVLLNELKNKRSGLSYDSYMLYLHMRLVAIGLLKHARYNPKLKHNIKICTAFKAKGQWQYATSSENEAYVYIKRYFVQIHHTLDLPTYISYKGSSISDAYFQELLNYLLNRLIVQSLGKSALRTSIIQHDHWLVY